jgi:MoxR-like ATPase
MQKIIEKVVGQISTVLLGKEQQVKLALTCLFSKGHLLVEDLPGMGKTTLAHALAKTLGLSYNRVQFTSDLLPADILGVTVYDRTAGSFEFHPGPIFCQLLLADEINRTTPKTQSALLEAMEERQVTYDGETRKLPSPFFVIATQNPVTQAGTFPLPESQLDRFLMRIKLGYPDAAVERALFQGVDPRARLEAMSAAISPEDIASIQEAASKVHVSDAILDYLQRVVHFTRTQEEFAYGLSPRGALALLHCAKTWAFIEGHNHVLPEHVQIVMPSAIGHRLREKGGYDEVSGMALVEKILNTVDVIG